MVGQTLELGNGPPSLFIFFQFFIIIIIHFFIYWLILQIYSR